MIRSTFALVVVFEYTPESLILFFFLEGEGEGDMGVLYICKDVTWDKQAVSVDRSELK